MNSLQGLHARHDYVVSLNAAEAIDPDQVVATMIYEHPVYTEQCGRCSGPPCRSLRRRDRLRRRASRLGIPRGRVPSRRRRRPVPRGDVVTAPTPWPGAALYDVTIRHHRRDPVVNRFVYGSYYWLIDVDRPAGAAATCCGRWPASTPPTTARRRTRSRCARTSSRSSAAHGIAIDGGPISLLTHARVLGHVFNPLSVYWCHRRRRHPGVRGRRGAQHLRRPPSLSPPSGRHGRWRRADKEFFVSPFNAVDGRYRMCAPRAWSAAGALRDARSTRRTRRSPLTVRGERLAADLPTLLRLAARHPMAPLVGSLRIRCQGLKLARRGLVAVGRPSPGGHGVGNVRAMRTTVTRGGAP